MSYNGSGTFTINSTGQPVVAGTVITASAFNALTTDLATGLTTAITKDGQTTTTARITFAQGITSSLVTDSSSVSTGSIITAGGMGVAKNLYVGVNANVAGTLGVTGVATFSAAPIYSSLTASSAVATDASKGLVSVTNTGTGNNVLATSPTITTPVISSIVNTGTLTLPTSTDTLVGRATTDTLTNKSIVASQLTGTQTIPKATLPTGSVLQVVSATKTDSFTSTTTASFTDITGMSVSITPTSSSSKIYVTVTGTCSGQAVTSGSQIRLVRGSTAICIGDASGSTTQASTNSYQADANQSNPFSISFLDSPATTSSTTYKIQFFITSSTFYFNRTQLDANNSNGRYASTITVMEISA